MQIPRIAQRLGLACAALLWAGSAAAQTPKVTLKHERFTLPNGLTVILHEDHSTPMVAVNVWYHVGSSYEKKGRTGFAHLFEHVMFEGSGNVKEGDFDNLLETVGGNNNGSTTEDRTNYYETLPSNALDLALFLESDRMGFLLNDLNQGKLDGQRDVVKNERRQRVDNQPYGLAWETIGHMLFNEGHPYHWPVIGYMEDLSAASLDDVKDFFRSYYVPNNAVLVIAGDINPAEARKKIEHWFSDVKPGKPVVTPEAPLVPITEPQYKTIEDRVQLPRLYMAWQGPRVYAPGDAELTAVANILAGGNSSRLYKRLVYELQIAQSVNAFPNSNALTGGFIIIATARPGVKLDQLKQVIDEEIARLAAEAPTERELQRVTNQLESQFLAGLESIEAKADQLNSYYRFTGNPDWAQEDLARYQALTPQDISAAVQTWLRPNARVLVSFVPQGKPELAVTPTK